MEDTTLLMVDLKRHKGSLSGVSILVLLVYTTLRIVLSVWVNSERYLREKMGRAGFGTLTVWVSNAPDMSALVDNIAGLETAGNMGTQVVTHSDYTANNQDSDSEGQLTPHVMENGQYKFFEGELPEYQGDIPKIRPEEIYVSPSMISTFGVQTGDEIRSQIARGGQATGFTMKGFYEDPLMGGSMIGMRGFLINEVDYSGTIQTTRDTGIDALVRDGAMLHIFQADTNREGVAVSQLNQLTNENTELPQYLEFLRSGNAVVGFILILQNVFNGFLATFVVVPTFVVLTVLGHGMGSSIEVDYMNMGTLKTTGFTGRKLRRIQLAQCMFVILTGMVLGILAAIYVSRIVNAATPTTTGTRIPTDLPVAWCLLINGLLFLILTGFIVFKMGKLKRATPMKVIGDKAFTYGTRVKKGPPIRGNHLKYSMAFRQLTVGARRYGGAYIMTILLVFFASMIRRMGTQLGANGKGMVDAFNPADRDIGVQIFEEHTLQEAEETVLLYTGIMDRYLLAMQGMSVNGIDYIASVITDPERLHIVEGRTSKTDDEIVMAEFVASGLGVAVGDMVTVQADLSSEEYVISGIYTCTDNIGDNIGMSREGYLRTGSDDPAVWCHHYFLEDASQEEAIIVALGESYSGDAHIHGNTWPGLCGATFIIQTLLVSLYEMVVAFILVATIMTGNRILSAGQRDIGTYKAVGFTSGQLRGTLVLRFTVVAVLTSIIGTTLAAILADSFMSIVMRTAGIGSFPSGVAVGNALVPSAAVIFLFTGFVYTVSQKVRKVDLIVLITE